MRADADRAVPASALGSVNGQIVDRERPGVQVYQHIMH